ncbi:hypothetical protein WN55_10117, partial [Dufourea novaeangliae]
NCILNLFKVLSYIMMCSWLGGLVILIFRIIKVNDFRILKIKIYQVENNVLLNKTDRDKEEEKKNTDKVKAQ